MTNNQSTTIPHDGFPMPFCSVCHQYIDMGTCRCTTGGPPPHPYKTSSPFTPQPFVPLFDDSEQFMLEENNKMKVTLKDIDDSLKCKIKKASTGETLQGLQALDLQLRPNKEPEAQIEIFWLKQEMGANATFSVLDPITGDLKVVKKIIFEDDSEFNSNG